MGQHMAGHPLLDDYATLLHGVKQWTGAGQRARENVPEILVQQLWYDRAAHATNLASVEGHALEVVSPGWWNHCAGPDFRGAQIIFNGTLYRGDVEVHLDAPCWQEHGHHRDPRYNDVILHAVLNPVTAGFRAETADGRSIPHLHLSMLGAFAAEHPPPLEDMELHGGLVPRRHGSCNRFLAEDRANVLLDFVQLSGDWRLLNKARRIEERMDAVGPDQATYEQLCRAMGYRPFTAAMERIAKALPYERAVQLSLLAPNLLESAFLHLGGLLPVADAAIAALPPHGQRLVALREEHLPTLRALSLDWPLVGVRPNNYPSRRLAGLASLVGRTARKGLARSLEEIWHEHGADPRALRRAMESLFPGAMGFWSRHYRFDGAAMKKSSAPVGSGRVRSIIGNVFVPLALAQARQRGDQTREAQVFSTYHKLPLEPDNQIYQRMIPRVFGDSRQRLAFHGQQGILQMHEDWCERNPSCRDCPVLSYLDGRDSASRR